MRTLLLTHGHIDHTWDAARLHREHGCALLGHAETVPMMTQRDFFKQYGFGWEVETVDVADLQVIDEGPGQTLGGLPLEVFLVPGHCPGSLCFLHQESQVLFGGDVLFAGGVGRWDLPGATATCSSRASGRSFSPLGDEIRVLPGHGPATTIGIERRTNVYVGDGADDLD